MRRNSKPHIIVALQLNGAPGRNEFLGISQFLAHGKSWNLTLAHSLDDINGALAGQQSISLKRTSLNVALLRFTFPLIETEE